MEYDCHFSCYITEIDKTNAAVVDACMPFCCKCLFDWWYPPCCCFIVPFYRDYGLHNRFLRYKLVTWHHLIGREVAGHNPYPLCTGLARWAQEGYGDSDDSIHRKCGRSHQLQAGEIPSVESPVMTRNTAWAGRLCEKVSLLKRLNFYHNRPAQAALRDITGDSMNGISPARNWWLCWCLGWRSLSLSP
jgi:hypothetical protein